MSPLFVCLDLQRAFLPNAIHGAPHAGQALIECRRLLTLARERRWRIAHCYLKRHQGGFCLDGLAARPVEGFEPRGGEIVLERSTLSAYGHDAFEALAASAGRNALMTSLSASVTWIATAFDAFERGHHFAFLPQALAAQTGGQASARDHVAVARDVAQLLGFSALAPRFAYADDLKRIEEKDK